MGLAIEGAQQELQYEYGIITSYTRGPHIHLEHGCHDIGVKTVTAGPDCGRIGAWQFQTRL